MSDYLEAHNAQHLHIAACAGVYSARDTAKHFGVTERTVRRIWAKDLDAGDIEPPNIVSTRVSEDVIIADYRILVGRGMNLNEIADYFGVGASTIRNTLRRNEARHAHTSNAQMGHVQMDQMDRNVQMSSNAQMANVQMSNVQMGNGALRA